jgi:hypothetical protein
MDRSSITGLALAALLALSACEYAVPLHETGEGFNIDPATGHLIRTTVWQNSDGGFATTQDDITQTGIDVRRHEPPPTHGILDF